VHQNVVNEDIFMLEFKQRVINTFLNEAIYFFEESPTYHFYKYIYDDHNLQFYNNCVSLKADGLIQ
jgi:hypothetical protein